MNNEATHCAVLIPALRAVERTTSTAAQHSLHNLCIKMHGNRPTGWAVSFFLSAILYFLIELGLIKIRSSPYACKPKAMHSTKAQRELAVSAQHDVFWTTALHGRQKSNTDSSIQAHRLAMYRPHYPASRHTHTYTHTYIHIHAHTHIHTYIHTHTVCVCVCVCVCENILACRKLHNEESQEYRFTKNH